MPYKIYTYADPYNLDKADFWDEISSFPHFCGARTLVNGLKDVLEDNIKGLICNLDAFIEHKDSQGNWDVYGNWTGNIGLRLQQHSILSAFFQTHVRCRKNRQRVSHGPYPKSKLFP